MIWLSYSWNEEWFCTKSEQKVVEELVKKTQVVFAGDFDVKVFSDVHGFDFRHVAEHGDRWLFESFRQVLAPYCQSN